MRSRLGGGIRSGFWARFGYTVRLARTVATESMLMPARRHDHSDLPATIRSLRVELREQRCEIQRLRVENEVLRAARRR